MKRLKVLINMFLARRINPGSGISLVVSSVFINNPHIQIGGLCLVGKNIFLRPNTYINKPNITKTIVALKFNNSYD